MAFKFRSKSSLSTGDRKSTEQDQSNITPKLTNSQLNKLAKVQPPWLKDYSSLKQLPGVYQGVLGQVQLQPEYTKDGLVASKQLFLSRTYQNDYMNRFTDTERVHQLLSASRLDDDALAAIWAHVNQTFPGKLTNREVCLALALIAIFQRLEKENSHINVPQSNKNPFDLVKLEKKPPVPVLYPNNQRRVMKNEQDLSSTSKEVKTSLSIPDALSSSNLLIDIGEGDEFSWISITKNKFSSDFTKSNYNDKLISLIDMDGDRFAVKFLTLSQVWLSFLSAVRSVFKRSFDVLNVEHSRQSAIEALKHQDGRKFSKNLCLCYPLAHNIKFRIEDLKKFQTPLDIEVNNQKHYEDACLFDKTYISQIDDLMNSINEYWAVLINLFHESGQTKFIEHIMDGLNQKIPTVTSKSISELEEELNGEKKATVCSICHTQFYLTNNESATKSLTSEEVKLVSNQDSLLSEDMHYYYHAKCANFWLNHVNYDRLPFQKSAEDDILSPAPNLVELTMKAPR